MKFIATREGSVPVKENSGNDPQKIKNPISSIFNFMRNQQNRLTNFVK